MTVHSSVRASERQKERKKRTNESAIVTFISYDIRTIYMWIEKTADTCIPLPNSRHYGILPINKIQKLRNSFRIFSMILIKFCDKATFRIHAKLLFRVSNNNNLFISWINNFWIFEFQSFSSFLFSFIFVFQFFRKCHVWNGV